MIERPHRRSRAALGSGSERLPLEQMLFGPAETTHGTQTSSALRGSRWRHSARTIREIHDTVEMVIAPSIANEGKSWQLGGSE